MRILIAPDKFKGALNAREVGDAIAAGIHDVLPNAKIDVVPMADGGEGTAEVISQALGGSWLKCRVHDPLGRELEAVYGWIEQEKMAVMEMSEAAGMRRLQPNELNPENTDTFGVGEMILDAVNRGAEEVIIGLGGSATNDGGFGMARALGYKFLVSRENQEEVEEAERIADLARLKKIEKPQSLKLPRITAAVDVRNPLLGENGATRVFGPQKGVTTDKIVTFERALKRLVDVVSEQFAFDYRNEPGAGAAGGLGFGLMSFCSAKIRPGFDVVAETVGLESKLRDFDLVITGEGTLDRQTLEGKTPAGVARLAHKHGKRVFAFTGRASDEREVRKLFDGVYVNARPGMSTEENMKCAAEFLQGNARQLAKEI